MWCSDETIVLKLLDCAAVLVDEGEILCLEDGLMFFSAEEMKIVSELIREKLVEKTIK